MRCAGATTRKTTSDHNYQAFYIGNEYSDKKENYNMKDLIKPDLKNLPIEEELIDYWNVLSK